jgi:hypothetical protein
LSPPTPLSASQQQATDRAGTGSERQAIKLSFCDILNSRLGSELAICATTISGGAGGRRKS